MTRQARLRLPVWTRRVLCVGAIACGVAGPARAQDTAGDAVVQQAKELYRQGSEHARKGDWERAYVSLKLSFDLVPHWSTAASLGQCELELDRHVDAATHLDYAARSLPFDAEEHEHIDGLLKRARSQVAGLDLQVNRDGAVVSLDGKLLGTAPVVGPLFVTPGEHIVTARVEGRPAASHRFVVDAGEDRTIALTIPERGSQAIPPEAAPAPAAPSRDSGDQGSPTKWIVIGTGASLALVAAGAGVVFHQRAVNADNDADVLRDQVGPSGCYNPTGDMTSKCTELANLVDDHHDNQRNSTTAWASAGVLAAATVATWLFWPTDSGSTPTVSAFAKPGSAGIAAMGRF